MAATSTLQARPQYASSSLYVGDLLPDVSETILYEFFNSIGPVASIRVCRDSSSRRSLRYAYVNYHSIADAERALETLNYSPIKGHPCRIMWSQRDPTVRKSPSGNLFVRNLDRAVDNRALHDTFSLFGNILSCKVVTDEQGRSKGYGFVHFESDEAARNAVDRVNGMKIGSKEVYVGPFQRRAERPNGRAENFTNVYCKNFPHTWTEETINNVFSPYGEITSTFLSADSRGRPFACINFAQPAAAKKAVQDLSNRCVTDDGVLPPEEQNEEKENGEANKATDNTQESAPQRLFVDRAQDKSERIATLRARYERGSGPRTKYEGVNLYIKNLSDSVDDAQLRKMFEVFGTITSAKVMRDEDGHSKGFGFVCFTTPEEATKALAEMHLQIHDSKPLYVGLAEQKDRRQARLQSHFKGSGSRPAPVPHAFNVPFYGGVVPNQPIGAWSQPPPAHFRAAAPNFMWKPPATVMPPMPGYPQQSRPGMSVPSRRPVMQKQVLGEQLFPLVQKFQPELAGKITGMMLDMSEEELRSLLSSEAELRAKIDEAMLVLEKAHQPSGNAPTF